MKTINRNNYEEFFLLYVDDELDEAGKLAVENFVQQHTDLATELEMLVQFKCEPETIVFEHKDALLRTEGNSINETNYEEYFLLYIDNELSPAKREEVEMYVLQHPKLQDEFTLLKQSVLAPEAISYGNKTGLYRTEKRRAFYSKPWRFAAAAILVSVCATGWWFMQKPSTVKAVADNNEAANQHGPATAKPDSIKAKLQPPQAIIAQQPEQKSLPREAVKTKGKKVAEAPVSTIKTENKPLVAESREEKKQTPQVVIQPQQQLADNDIKEPPAEIKNAAMPQSIIQKKEEDNNSVDAASLQASAGNNQTANNFSVQPVAYKEINTSDDDRSLHVGMFDLNKDKVKGLFKRAGRILGNKSNDLANEDGKLQVANFEIETKKL